MTDFLARHRQTIGDHVGFEKPVLHEVGDGVDAGARELREVIVVEKAFPGIMRPDQRQRDQHRERSSASCGGIEAAQAKRIEPPQQVRQRHGSKPCEGDGLPEIRENREQVAERRAIDHHHVDEVHRHLHDVVFQSRQQDQHRQHRKRQPAGNGRAASQRDQQHVEGDPAQQECGPRDRIDLGHDQQHKRCELRRNHERDAPESGAGRSACECNGLRGI